MLFAALKGSMELLADRDPEEARKILDAVLEPMMEAVHRYEGTLNQVRAPAPWLCSPAGVAVMYDQPGRAGDAEQGMRHAGRRLHFSLGRPRHPSRPSRLSPGPSPLPSPASGRWTFSVRDEGGQDFGERGDANDRADRPRHERRRRISEPDAVVLSGRRTRIEIFGLGDKSGCPPVGVQDVRRAAAAQNSVVAPISNASGRLGGQA